MNERGAGPIGPAPRSFWCCCAFSSGKADQARHPAQVDGPADTEDRADDHLAVRVPEGGLEPFDGRNPEVVGNDVRHGAGPRPFLRFLAELVDYGPDE